MALKITKHAPPPPPPPTTTIEFTGGTSTEATSFEDGVVELLVVTGGESVRLRLPKPMAGMLAFEINRILKR